MGATQGLDISYAQGANVNYSKIKAAGYDFVILRAGYGSAIKYPNQFDTTFESNYKKAKAAGLKVGAYWFTYCTTTTGAVDEAKSFVKALSGKQFEMPVYMDIEVDSQFKTGKANCSAMAKAFCEYMEKAGFFAGIYCSTFWGNSYLTDEVRARFAYWVAEWGTKCNYKGTYGMWQNGTAYVSGSGTGAIDHDYCYVDYTTIIKNKGLNGYAKPTVAEKILDSGSCYTLGEITVGSLAVKELLRLAYNKKLVTVQVDDAKVYNETAIKAVKELQKKWGYKQTGLAGENFVRKLYSVL